MKVQTLLLGYFSDEKPVHVYRLPNNNNQTYLLLYKLSDISLLFGLPHLPQHPALATNLLSNNSPHCYRDNQDLYLSTKLLGETAISLNKYQLAEFCKFKPNDYTAGLADSILDSMPRFERVKKMGPWSSMDLPSFSSSSSSIETNNNHRTSPTSSYLPPASSDSKRQQESTPPSRRNEIRSHSSHQEGESTLNDSNQQRKSSPLVKTEPLSPPPSFVPASPSRDQNNNNNNNNSNNNNSSNNSNNNPMALNSVLTNGDRRRSGSAADDHPQQQQQGSNKRQRVDNNNESANSNNSKKRQSFRNVLPKPMHTVGSQSTTTPSALLSKRLQSKQGKNTRHLTIFAPSYNNQPALGIRSAPLHSNFFQQQQQHPPGTGGIGPNGLIQPPTLASSQHPHPHPHQLRHQQHPSGHLHPPPPHPPHTGNGHSHPQQQQQQQKTYYYGQGPSTSLPQSSQAPRMGMLHPGHTLAPLLSPRAPLPSHRDPPQTSQHHHHPQRMSSPRSKQEFAIPPIVPSQQQPPLTAHPSSTFHTYVASPMYQRNGSGNNNNGSGSSSSNSNGTNHPVPATAALPTTARDVPLPPQTPTTNSFGSLQRQQFLQPFEHLFETIETSRTLKSTLDDQIRRSSTLMQTLQASSTTIEGLVRNQIKEAQKEMMAEMDATFENILQRIEKLEQYCTKSCSNKNAQPSRSVEQQEEATSPPPPVPSNTSKRQEEEEEQDEGQCSGKSTNGFLRSPPTIVRSQNDIGPNEYHGLLNALRERLDRLERQFDN